MFWPRKAFILLGIGAAPVLGGCGLYVPQPHEFYEAESNDTLFQNVVLNNVKCELHKGVQNTLDHLNIPENPRVNWIKNWGAKAAFTFTTEELSSVNPSVTFTPPPPFSLFFDIGASAHATREEDMDVTYAFKDLLSEGRIEKCDRENGMMIQGDLDIAKFIEKHVYLLTIPGTLPLNLKAIENSLSYKITFVASYNADLNPSWTFKHVAVNSGGKLLSGSRSKTTNLILTFAPVSSDSTPARPAELNAEGIAAHDIARIGQATAIANTSNAR